MPPVRRFSIAVALRGRGGRYQCRHGPSAGERYMSPRPLVARARIRTRKGRSRKERSEKLEKLYHRYSLVSTTAFEPLGALGASGYRDHGTRTRRVSGRVIQLLSYVSRPSRVLKTYGSDRGRHMHVWRTWCMVQREYKRRTASITITPGIGSITPDFTELFDGRRWN